MEILYIDPWCENGSNLYKYSSGLVSGLSKTANLSVAVPYNFFLDGLNETKIYRWFFKKSNSMKRGFLRKIIRGLEYINAYLKILSLCKKHKYDVVHIEWPLSYKIDLFFWKRIKKHCSLFVIKAHNVLPHSSGEKYIYIFAKLYALGDIVLVHGSSIKNELVSLFPFLKGKVFIQKYGFHKNHDISFDKNLIDKQIANYIDNSSLVLLFCGGIHYDKGLDVFIDYWIERHKKSNAILIISGRVEDGYVDFANYEKKIKTIKNIVYNPGYVDDNTFNYYFNSCDAVVLPYRKGFMSAVVFSCAEYKKTFISTNFGSVNEYCRNGIDSFICDNYDCLKSKIDDIIEKSDKESLKEMGQQLHDYFISNYDWDVIGKELAELYGNALKQ